MNEGVIHEERKVATKRLKMLNTPQKGEHIHVHNPCNIKGELPIEKRF